MSKQIYLTGIVNDVMAGDIRQSLLECKDKVIDIYISCIGGDVNSGFEIANVIQGIQAGGKKDIHTHNLSHADSIATVIFLSAKKENRHAVENSTLFMHEPRFMYLDETTRESGTKAVQELEIQTKRIADFYVKTIDGLTNDEALSLMKEETNLSASKMLEYGIISEVKDSFAIAAQRNLITNYNTDMSLFKTTATKKVAVFAVKLEDGSTLIHEGELAVGSEVSLSGETEPLNGTFKDEDGNDIVVVDGVVTEIVPMEPEAEAEAEPLAIDAEGIAAIVSETVSEAVTEMETRIEASIKSQIQAIRKVGSSVKIEKVEAPNAKAKMDIQAIATEKTRKRMNEIQRKKRESQIN